LRVVVEPAHKLRIFHVLNADFVQKFFHKPMEFLVFRDAVIDKLRSKLCQNLAVFHFAIEQSKRIRVQSSLAIFTKVALFSHVVIHKSLFILFTTFFGTDVVQLHSKTVFNSQVFKNFPGEKNALHIQRRITLPDNFHAKLPEHSVTTFLRSIVTKVRLDVEKFHRLRQLLHAMLNVGAHCSGRSFRFQSEAASALVQERVHFFGNNIRVFSNTAIKHFRVLQNRSGNTAKPGLTTTVPGNFLNKCKKLVIFRKDVVDALRSL